MGEDQGELELRFEKALIEVLSQDYDLDVRLSADSLDRRREGVATLSFSYRYPPDKNSAKAIISVDGAGHFSNVLPVDFRNRKGIESSAENCRTLVEFLKGHLAECREKELEATEAGPLKYGRRDDDLA